MKVVYSDGSEGTLSAKDSENLYVQNRFTLESWKALEHEMVQLDIIKFEDPFLSTLGADLVSIDEVFAIVFICPCKLSMMPSSLLTC